MRRNRWWIVALLVVALIAAGCGDDDEESDAEASDSAEQAEDWPELTGEPIKIGVIAGVDSTTGVSMPWVPEAAEVAAAAVNAEGGIDGRPVEIVFCDHKSTTQDASVCAQELLQEERVLMLAGGDGLQDGAILPAVEAADTILWATAGAHADALANERAYILNPVLVANWGVPQLLPDDVDTVAYVSADIAIAREGRERTVQFFDEDVTIEPLDVPFSVTDFQPYCLQVREAEAQAVMASFNSPQISTMMQTCTQIGLSDLTWVVPSSTVTPEIIETIDELGLDNRSVQAFSSEAYENLAADDEEFGDEVGHISNLVADQALATWLGVKLLPTLVEGAGSVDAAAIRTWLDQQTALETDGATPPIDFTASPLPTLPRVKNVTPWGGEYAEGTVQPGDSPLEIDLSRLSD